MLEKIDIDLVEAILVMSAEASIPTFRGHNRVSLYGVYLFGRRSSLGNNAIGNDCQLEEESSPPYLFLTISILGTYFTLALRLKKKPHYNLRKAFLTSLINFFFWKLPLLRPKMVNLTKLHPSELKSISKWPCDLGANSIRWKVS